MLTSFWPLARCTVVQTAPSPLINGAAATSEAEFSSVCPGNLRGRLPSLQELLQRGPFFTMKILPPDQRAPSGHPAVPSPRPNLGGNCGFCSPEAATPVCDGGVSVSQRVWRSPLPRPRPPGAHTALSPSTCSREASQPSQLSHAAGCELEGLYSRRRGSWVCA